MIIWSRWGFLSFLAIGFGVATAFGLNALLDDRIQGQLIGATIFLFAAIYNLVLAFFVYPRLDKARPVTYTVPLPQPIKHPNGQVQTHAVRPALDSEGRQLWTQPRSTLFFIPATVLWIPCLLGAVVLAVLGLVSG
ncbi:MAG TPA: hypothetical protein VEX66_06860 [Microlunatus sp.]|nr:hypothetical protein [Microlunatus sp.]